MNMTYDDIMKISDIGLKEQELKIYYISKIKIEEWFLDNSEEQIVRFANRIEHKKNNKLHKLDGPAIVYTDSRKLYYIDGVPYLKDEWEKKSKPILRKMKFTKIVK